MKITVINTEKIELLMCSDGIAGKSTGEAWTKILSELVEYGRERKAVISRIRTSSPIKWYDENTQKEESRPNKHGNLFVVEFERTA